MVYWALPVVGLALDWNLVTTALGRYVVVVLFALVTVALVRKWFELGLLVGIFSYLVIVNSWVFAGAINHFYGTTLTFIVVLTIGFISARANHSLDPAMPWIYWLLVALVTAQINSLIFYLPFNFIEQTLLSGVFFYYIWYWLEGSSRYNAKQKLQHLVYVTALAILVIGEAIWTNFSQLNIF